MILWTFKPLKIYEMIQMQGIYRCDSSKIDPFFRDAYDWLTIQMRKRLGPPPEGVEYPVWAWHTQNWKHAKPDLRRERWCYGSGGESYVCMEIEIPDKDVLLSDFDSWHAVLNRYLVSETEDEDKMLNSYFESIPEEKKRSFMQENWERVFDIRPLKNNWSARGEYIQAVFWELRKSDIRKVRYFQTTARKY